MTGTDEDPQNLNSQIDQLKEAGAWVDTSNEVVVRYVGRILRALANADSVAAATDWQTGGPGHLEETNGSHQRWPGILC